MTLSCWLTRSGSDARRKATSGAKGLPGWNGPLTSRPISSGRADAFAPALEFSPEVESEAAGEPFRGDRPRFLAICLLLPFGVGLEWMQIVYPQIDASRRAEICQGTDLRSGNPLEHAWLLHPRLIESPPVVASRIRE